MSETGIRASTEQRDETIDLLTEAFNRGRLNTDEWNDRVRRAAGAVTVEELRGLLDDLPYLGFDELTANSPIPPGAYEKWMKDAALALEEKKRIDGVWLKLSVLTVNFVVTPTVCAILLWNYSPYGAMLVATILMALCGFIAAVGFVVVQESIERNHRTLGVLVEFMREKLDSTFGGGR